VRLIISSSSSTIWLLSSEPLLAATEPSVAVFWSWPIGAFLVAVSEGSDPLTYGDQECTDRPNGDVTLPDDRWAWIAEEDGMWAKWVNMPTVAPQERTLLVSLTIDDLLQRRFAPVVQALPPTGANNED
jgi:hypothetical protein